MPVARTVVRLVVGACWVVLLIGGVPAVSRQVAGQEAVDGDVRPASSRSRVRAVRLRRGVVVDLGAGSALMVKLWASRWGLCRAGQLSLTTAARRCPARGVRLLGVNGCGCQASAEGYVDELEVPFPSLVDPAGMSAARPQAFALPSTSILDRDGVAGRLTGETTVRILSTRLDAPLACGGRWAG